jgi:hypothetical protein
MLLDENVVREVLGRYNFTLEELLEVSKHKKPKAEGEFIYLIHHLHPPVKAADMEVVHHCIMFEKKNLKGEQYEQMHVKDGKVFWHALKVKDIEKAPEVVYDHLNNGFKVKIMEIDKEKYAVIYGLVSVEKTKWSDQDK